MHGEGGGSLCSQNGREDHQKFKLGFGRDIPFLPTLMFALNNNKYKNNMFGSHKRERYSFYAGNYGNA